MAIKYFRFCRVSSTDLVYLLWSSIYLVNSLSQWDNCKNERWTKNQENLQRIQRIIETLYVKEK